MPKTTFFQSPLQTYLQSSVHSYEGYSVLTIIPILYYSFRSYPGLFSNISAAVITQVISSFFSHTAEKRRVELQDHMNERSIALHDANAMINDAETAYERESWVIAAQKYLLAAKEHRRANEISNTISTQIQGNETRYLFLAASCWLFAGKLDKAKQILETPNQSSGANKLIIAAHPHQAQINALRGVIHLLSHEYESAKTYLQQSIEEDPYQHNIYLIYAFLCNRFKEIVSEYNMDFMGNEYASKMIEADCFNRLTLYYYALSLLKMEKLDAAIAILEKLLLSNKTTKKLGGSPQDLHRALAQGYESLAEKGDCGTLFAAHIELLSDRSMQNKPAPVQENLALINISLIPKAGKTVVELRKKSQEHLQSIDAIVERESNIEPISMGC